MENHVVIFKRIEYLIYLARFCKYILYYLMIIIFINLSAMAEINRIDKKRRDIWIYNLED